MKYLSVFFAFALLFILSCNNETETGSKRVNLLIPSVVKVNQLFSFDTTVIPLWQKEIKAANLIEKLFEKVMKSEITVFDPLLDTIKYTKEDILKRMGIQSEPVNLSEIQSVYFDEEWSLDTTEPFLFEKKVISWCPVRYFTKDSMELKKLIFKVKEGNPTELLAKNVISEFNLEDTVSPEFVKNIDKNRLRQLLIDYALSGKVKLWNAANTETELTKEVIIRNLGQTNDTILIEDPESGKVNQQVLTIEYNLSEIESIVFVEDWYYDPATFAIKKLITGIGPVRYYTKEDGEEAKSIVFVMYFGKEKTRIF
jgi:hypothetical protein